MATKTYKPKRKISATESEEIKIPASSVDGLSTVATSGSYNDLSNKPTIPDVSGKANLTGGNTFTGKQTLNSPASDGYSINAAGYVKGSWLQASAISNKGSNTGKVCVFDNSGWIYYRTPAEILTEAGGAKSSDIPTNYVTTDTSQEITGIKSFNKKTKFSNGIQLGDGNTLYGASDVSNIENYMPQKDGTLAVVGDIPTKVSELTNDSGYTTNKGTVTQVKINGTTKSPDGAGLVDLGTVGGGGATDAVKYTPQTLTASQKTQARSNIGAGTGNGTVTGVKINGSTKGTSGVVDLGYIKVKVNGTTYTADSDGLIDLGTISGGGSTSASQYNDIY